MRTATGENVRKSTISQNASAAHKIVTKLGQRSIRTAGARQTRFAAACRSKVLPKRTAMVKLLTMWMPACAAQIAMNADGAGRRKIH